MVDINIPKIVKSYVPLHRSTPLMRHHVPKGITSNLHSKRTASVPIIMKIAFRN